MSDLYQVITPENVEIDYELAGIGSRFLAVSIDISIQSLLSIGLVYGLQLLGFKTLSLDTEITQLSTSVFAAITIILSGIIWLGYYVILETVYNGQTIGKKLINIRVRKEKGYAPNFWDILLRNMIRPIDFLPFFYGIGFLTMFSNSKSKRLGDFAAGTIVIKEMPRKAIRKYLATQTTATKREPDPETTFSALETDEWLQSLLSRLSQEDYLLILNLKSRENQLINYRELAATTLHYLVRKSGLEIPIASKVTPYQILDQLIFEYEKKHLIV